MATILNLQGSDVLAHKVTPFSDRAPAGVSYGFFGREGGVSEGLYRGLNCGVGSGDNPDHVRENRAIIAAEIGVAPEKLLSLYQIHSPLCVVVDEPWALADRPQADAMVTDRAGVALGILTADCAPVLFYGVKEGGAPVIGAAHAGWKGAVGGALDATIAQMLDLGVQAGSLHACIGPCISKSSYEVGEEFFRQFVEQDDAAEHFFGSARQEGHYMFDLAGFCAYRLSGAGVKFVYINDNDTYSNENKFFSYRRTTHREEPDYGRQLSVIAIKG
jgi:YfiH family protein